MKLKKILSFIPFIQYTSIDDQIDIQSIEMDSRAVQPNSLFVCIKGFTVDGHDYVEEAIHNGAVAIVAEKEVETSVPLIIVPDTVRFLAMVSAKYYNFPTNNLSLIGVTGTNGKTTVTYLLEKIFNHHHKKTGIIGTIQMKIGSKVFPIKNTTPDALFLQKMIHQMVQEEVEQVIMEVSSHALDLGRVYGCDFNIAVFTNLSHDHLDYHHTMEDYLRAKSLLFAQLGNNYNNNKSKYAIINADDNASELLKRSTAQNILTYGMNNHADVFAENISLDASGTSFDMITPNGKVPIDSKLIGRFNVYNILAASSVAIVSGIPLKTIQESLSLITGVSGRFEPIYGNQSYSVIIDYAHTPDSLKNVLQTIQDIAKRNVYVVIGCGGDRDRTKRPQMGSIAVKYANRAIFTSDNPRTESPQVILNDMIEGLSQNNYDVILDREQAITYAVNLAQENDIILIAGKGHETYQQIGLKKYEFDDREVAKAAIRAKEQ